jgi:hypothetical protein
MVYKMRGARGLAQRDFAAAFAMRDQSLGRRSYIKKEKKKKITAPRNFAAAFAMRGQSLCCRLYII